MTRERALGHDGPRAEETATPWSRYESFSPAGGVGKCVCWAARSGGTCSIEANECARGLRWHGAKDLDSTDKPRRSQQRCNSSSATAIHTRALHTQVHGQTHGSSRRPTPRATRTPGRGTRALTHPHPRTQPHSRTNTATCTQALHTRAHSQTHGGATYSLRCPRRRVEAYTHPRTHTAAPTHQHHPSGSSGGTSGAAVGRPTGAQHSRHSYSVAADSSQQGPATTSKAAAAGGGAADVPRTLRRHFQADP